jgi:hypothetical protein
VQRAVQLSALTRGPPTLVKVEWHNVESTSIVVLDTSMTEKALPPLELELGLEIVADVQSATLTARGGRIELVFLGEASILARLKYKSVLVKEHATGISCVPRDPFTARSSAPERPASVDIPI